MPFPCGIINSTHYEHSKLQTANVHRERFADIFKLFEFCAKTLEDLRLVGNMPFSNDLLIGFDNTRRAGSGSSRRLLKDQPTEFLFFIRLNLSFN